ncbi:MAG: YibE/F family protein [Firmicutes bacterium]|jgi:uncharacterized membrane protein|nr:YibE/F family protein [Bacillota bacterium]
MKKFISYLLILILCISSSISFASEKDAAMREYYDEKMNVVEEVVKAKIIDITYDDTAEERPDIPIESDVRFQHLKIQLVSGDHKGEVFTVRNTIEYVNPYNLIFKKGESVLLYQTETTDGAIEGLRIFERPRSSAIYFIIGLLFIVLVLIGGRKGFKSSITLVFTGLIIFLVMIPLLLKGFNPILVSVLTCAVTSAFTLIVVSGRNKKTATAIMGTVGGVLAAAIIAIIVGNWARLTGLGNEEAQLLAYVPHFRNLDYKGLLFAGVIIGALGAVMDVAMSISSAMSEIENIHPKITNMELFKSGMNVGKDIMGSMSNTLILAYVGSSIQVLLLFYSFNVSSYAIINMDHMASEIIRAMAGSIGLVFAIPITAAIYVKFRKK